MKKVLVQILKEAHVIKEEIFDYPENRSEEDVLKDIQEILNSNQSKTPTLEEIFSFAIDKSWVEIKDIFQYNLIMFHKDKTKPGSDAYKSLKMNKPTYYSTHRKLTNKGFCFPDYRMKAPITSDDQVLKPLQGYIQGLKDSSWVAASKQFEEDVFRFLYHQYGYNKVRLSEILGLGYSAVIDKTKSLTKMKS